METKAEKERKVDTRLCVRIGVESGEAKKVEKENSAMFHVKWREKEKKKVVCVSRAWWWEIMMISFRTLRVRSYEK